MKKIIWIALSALILCFMQSVAVADSVTGLWKTIDDVTGKPKSIIQLSESGGQVSGTILKIFPRPGYDQNETCEACKGDKHNQKIVGMTILTGMTAEKDSPGVWSGGRILDPMNGKTYRCAIHVTGGGQTLDVRGYIGIQLLGRTQVWHRVNSVN